MSTAVFRFYEELNDFLPPGRRKVQFPYEFTGTASVKFAIEALGVPHSEVDMILVNGEPVDFSYKLKEGDMISVYPVFESLDISNPVHLRERPLRDPKFVLDVHLGKLAGYLRFCGFDSIYRNDLEDNEIVDIGEKESRTILTRDLDLLKNKRITRGYRIRSSEPVIQLKEVITRLDLKKSITLFARCMECNGELKNIEKEKILHLLEPKTKIYFNNFRICASCSKIYWQGSHYLKMLNTIEMILK